MLPPYLIEVRAFSSSAAGGTTGLVALSSIAGSFAYGALTSRLGQGPIVLAAVAILISAAIPAFHSGLVSSVGIAFAAFAVGGAGVLVGHVFASVPRLVVEPSQIGPANGLIAQIGSIGALTGPPVVGFLVAANGWIALSLLVVVFAVFFAVFMSMAERARDQAGVADPRDL
jgi:nitrate/nitrite transporter NarK